ncbi:hypothetical protein [Chamaesiphon sp. OTE_75_metabat_556]|uniref:hypothetical protein n=1 Tax=Chamaesiphon sp. OTE_75_metabat_556 TaxID=2964692 RepID=UPI00286C2555|nr:hypothetical protein [Chamaesiphon sp. OTE_75_metabat_556]
MNIQNQRVKIQNEKGFVFDAEVRYYRADSIIRKWALEFTSSITRELFFMEGDVFRCLTQLRLELAKDGYKILCAGARIDVYPSGMSRDMGGGVVANVLSSKAEKTDLDPTVEGENAELVHIFDYAEPDLIVSVEEQFNYFTSGFSYSYELMILHSSTSIIEGTISGNTFLERNRIEFTSPVTPKYNILGKNKFECLLDLRKELEKFGYRPLCNGARFDAYPLPSDLKTYNGDFLHILTLGQEPNEEDQVETFEYAEPDLITSIAEQRKYYESWLESVKPVK